MELDQTYEKIVKSSNEFLNLPNDVLIKILLFLNNLELEGIGFQFNPRIIASNIKNDIIWKSWNCEIEKKYCLPIKSLKNLYNFEYLQKRLFNRVSPVVINILSNYCHICNSFIFPKPNFFKLENHYILCNHIPFSDNVLKEY